MMLICPISRVFALGVRIERERVVARVMIDDSRKMRVDIRRPVEIMDPERNRCLFRGMSFTQVIRVAGRELEFENGDIYPGRIYIRLIQGGKFELNGSEYRGDLELVVKYRRIIAVNHIPLEMYLKGVVPSEVSKTWRQEALKAQAVASRTYAYYHLSNPADPLWDIPLGRQAYRGVDAENPRTSWAVDVTYGQVLTFKDKVFPAYFCAVCGGYTEESEAVWRSKSRKDMPSTVRCTFCRNSDYFWWEYEITNSRTLKRFNANGYKFKVISKVQPGVESPFFPRLRSVFVFADGERHSIPVNEFRKILNYNRIRSSIFSVKPTGKGFLFSGNGWGHGVGMCQYGAKTMAENGMSFKEILQFYYPSTRLKKVY